MFYKKLIFTGLIYGAISLLLLLASGFVQFIYSVYLKNPYQIELGYPTTYYSEFLVSDGRLHHFDPLNFCFNYIVLFLLFSFFMILVKLVRKKWIANRQVKNKR